MKLRISYVRLDLADSNRAGYWAGEGQDHLFECSHKNEKNLLYDSATDLLLISVIKGCSAQTIIATLSA